MDMIVLEEKLATVPTLFVEKRDGRRVVFDVDKIDKALHKAAEKSYGPYASSRKTPKRSG